uniref:Uncharacterized protein n=1 Tax=Steinernema glaseri TaxID=37863 RepID=A0A1I7Z5G4_9BILA
MFSECSVCTLAVPGRRDLGFPPTSRWTSALLPLVPGPESLARELAASDPSRAAALRAFACGPGAKPFPPTLFAQPCSYAEEAALDKEPPPSKESLRAWRLLRRPPPPPKERRTITVLLLAVVLSALSHSPRRVARKDAFA